MENRYSELEKLLGIRFTNQKLLQTAFTHKSFLNEKRRSEVEDNERLEFLGDAVLELIVTEFLYTHYNESEGVLTSWRSALVKKETLANLARELQFGQYLFLSKGEEITGGREKDYILANTFEAFLGALFLDQGYQIAREFIENKLLIFLKKILAEKLHIDAKSFFQEKAQEEFAITPNYKLLAEEGPDHQKNFVMGAYLGENLVGRGEGNSKQAAEQAAARAAIQGKGW